MRCETATTCPSWSTCSPSCGSCAVDEPIAVILNTVKGKKVSRVPVQSQLAHLGAARRRCRRRRGCAELWEQDGKRLGIPAELPAALHAAIEIVGPLHGNPDHITDRQA